MKAFFSHDFDVSLNFDADKISQFFESKSVDPMTLSKEEREVFLNEFREAQKKKFRLEMAPESVIDRLHPFLSLAVVSFNSSEMLRLMGEEMKKIDYKGFIRSVKDYLYLVDKDGSKKNFDFDAYCLDNKLTPINTYMLCLEIITQMCNAPMVKSLPS